MIHKIFVGNLPESTHSDDLQPLFDKYGKVVECVVIRDFAFVHMENEDEAKSAIDALNGTEFNGSRLKVDISRRSQGGSGEYRRGGGYRGGGDGGYRGRGGFSGGYDRQPRGSDSYGRNDGGSGGGYQQRDSYQSRGPRRDYEEGSGGGSGGGGYRSGGHRNYSNDD